MLRKEVKEIDEVKEVKERNENVAAFFDLDGTLIARPSMEKRFFSSLRYRRVIGIRNYLLWLAEAMRLAPRGLNQIMHTNKLYLRGVRADVEGSGGTEIPVRLITKNEASKNGERRRQARMSVPPFYPEAIERVAWHVERRHWIVIVSGTLEPLAERAARVLEAELGERGQASDIRVCATRLEEKNEKWTGRIAGEAMFGEAKARAIRRLAAEADLDLERCFAYGDSSSDRWMLETVGRPAAVNPSHDLARIARRNNWPVLRWAEEKNLTPRARRAHRSQSAEETRQELQAEQERSGYGT
ncbi:MAG: HAD family hydrolase [Candidatus Acidiferrales bacterium]